MVSDERECLQFDTPKMNMTLSSEDDAHDCILEFSDKIHGTLMNSHRVPIPVDNLDEYVDALDLASKTLRVWGQRKAKKMANEKFEERKEEYRAVHSFLEWCRWRGISLIGPDPFYDKEGHSQQNIDLVRSESIHGSPFDKVWCQYIGNEFEEYQKWQEQSLVQCIADYYGERDKDDSDNGQKR